MKQPYNKRMQSDQNARFVPFSAVEIISSSVRCGSFFAAHLEYFRVRFGVFAIN